MSKEEFISVSDDIFDILNLKILGKYILEDVGTNFFMNWGLRLGFGPVLLDFPYVFELDGSKLYCNKLDLTTGEKCNGLIDYDVGFNKLVCTKCGKVYFATELKKDISNKIISIRDSIGDVDIVVTLGDEIVKDFSSDITESDILK